MSSNIAHSEKCWNFKISNLVDINELAAHIYSVQYWTSTMNCVKVKKFATVIIYNTPVKLEIFAIVSTYASTQRKSEPRLWRWNSQKVWRTASKLKIRYSQHEVGTYIVAVAKAIAIDGFRTQMAFSLHTIKCRTQQEEVQFNLMLTSTVYGHVKGTSLSVSQ
jgi:hypothetical protein